MLGAQPGNGGVEARLRWDDAHVGGRRLGDHRGDLSAALGEQRLQRRQVVVGQDDGLSGLGGGDAGGVRQAERGDARARGNQQRVDVAVVAPGELHDQRAAGEAARQPDRRHGRLRSRGHQPDHLDRCHPAHDLLGELDLGRSRGPEGEAAGDRLADGRHHARVRMPQDHRPPRADEVHVRVAIHVGQVRAGARGHEPRGPADRAERAHRRVHPTRRDHEGAVEPRPGLQGARHRTPGFRWPRRASSRPSANQPATSAAQ